MRFTTLLLLPLTTALAAQTGPAPTARQTAQANNRVQQEAEELRDLRETFSQVLDTVNASWFGNPYRQIKAVDLNGTIAIVLNGSAVSARIQQLTQGAVRGVALKNGEAFGTLQGTYFANGDHIYNINSDFGLMRFQRNGDKGFWYIRDQNAYTTAVSLAPPDAPASFMGWFASVMSDIREVYVKGTTFKVSKGNETTIEGKATQTIVFDSPTAPYDPRKREQPTSETFGFWKKGRMVVAYDQSSKQPLRMVFSNTAQGIDATMNFSYDANGRVRQVAISNRSKQWEGPSHVMVRYNQAGMISAISGELTGQTHKITFDLSTTWNINKPASSLQALVPPNATKLGREDMELRMAMLFASGIGDLQRAGFNFMAPKVAPVIPAGTANTANTAR